MTSHYAKTLHTLASRLGWSDDDYRAHLVQTVGKGSSKELTEAEYKRVLGSMRRAEEAQGLGTSTRSKKQWLSKEEFAQKLAKMLPQERLAYKLWGDLKKQGKVKDGSDKALQSWVKREVGVDDLRFCNWPQLDTIVQRLKQWRDRS